MDGNLCLNILCEIYEKHIESNHVDIPRRSPTVVAFKMGLTLVLTARKLYISGLAVQVYLCTLFWGGGLLLANLWNRPLYPNSPFRVWNAVLGPDLVAPLRRIRNRKSCYLQTLFTCVHPMRNDDKQISHIPN